MSTPQIFACSLTISQLSMNSAVRPWILACMQSTTAVFCLNLCSFFALVKLILLRLMLASVMKICACSARRTGQTLYISRILFFSKSFCSSFLNLTMGFWLYWLRTICKIFFFQSDSCIEQPIDANRCAIVFTVGSVLSDIGSSPSLEYSVRIILSALLFMFGCSKNSSDCSSCRLVLTDIPL